MYAKRDLIRRVFLNMIFEVVAQGLRRLVNRKNFSGVFQIDRSPRNQLSKLLWTSERAERFKRSLYAKRDFIKSVFLNMIFEVVTQGQNFYTKDSYA